MKYTKNKQALIRRIKRNFTHYKYEGKQGVLLDNCDMGIKSPINTEFFPFSELSEEELGRIINEELPRVTDTELYVFGAGSFNGHALVQGIYNYKNDDNFIPYSWGVANEERLRNIPYGR